MGGGKGGSDFDPKGKSDGEVMRFCQSFMTELQRHIGPYTDVPAGDIGVGGREIGFLFGQYKRIRNEFTGVLTGKGLEWGGSLIRPEATGYGAVYFAEEMLKTRDETLEGKTCLVSGSGNVAQYTVEKLLDLGARPVTLSRLGRVHLRPGRDRPREARVGDGPEERRRGRIMRVRRAILERDVHPRRSEPFDEPAVGDPRRVRVPVRDPERDQRQGRRQPPGRTACTSSPRARTCRPSREGVERFVDAKILYGPGKAANAGGVAVTGLEMAQNSERRSWRREEVDERLHRIMVEHPHELPRDRRRVRRTGQLRARREHRRVPQGRRRDARAGDRLDRLQAGHRPLEEREDRADLADILVGDVGTVAGREPVHVVRRAAVGEPVDVGERLAKGAP